MIWDVLIVIGYIIVGLFVARRILFHLQATTDRANERRRQHLKVCHGWPTCYHSDHSSPRGYQEYWGDRYWGLPLWGGLLWPLTAAGTAVLWALAGLCMGAALIGRGIEPAAKWFFENPKHRKERLHGQLVK